MTALVLAGVCVAVLFAVITTTADVDLWGHVRFGGDILRDGLPVRDPYSFTSDRRWVNHEWLTEVTLALGWRAAGPSGLIAIKLGCTAAVLVLLAPVFRVVAMPVPTLVMVYGLLLLGILPRVSHVRPQLFSVVLFAALVRIMTTVRHGSPLTAIWIIPVLALWANFHGGWLVGVATVALWAVGEAWARRSQPRSATLIVLCAIAGAAATLVNPYGVGLWTFMLDTVRFGRIGIDEWGPAWSSPTLMVWIAFALLTVAAVRRMSWPRNPSTVLIPILWGMASLRVARLDTFFALSVLGFLTAPVASVLAHRGQTPESLPVRWRIAPIAGAMIAFLALPAGRSALTCISMNASRYPEPQAIDFMKEQGVSGRMVTFFDWGEYAIWHLAPGIQVSMDGRRETVYSDETFVAHLDLYGGTASGMAYLQHLDPQFLWLPTHGPAVRALDSAAWVKIFEGPRSTLFAAASRQGGGFLPRTITEEPQPRCFPGP